MSYLLPDSPFLGALTIACLFVLLAVPILTILNWIQRISMGRRIDSKVMTGSWIAWAVALTCGMFSASHLLNDFKVEREITQQIPTESILSDTLRVDFADNPYKNGWLHFGPNQIFDNELINDSHRIRIEKAEGDEFEIIHKKCSRGRNLAEAEELAYGIISDPITTYSSVQFPSYFRLSRGTKYRGQHITTVIRVPEGKNIEFSNMDNHSNQNIHYNREYGEPWIGEGKVWRMSESRLVLPSYIEDPNELAFSNFSDVDISGDLQVEVKKSDRFEVSMRGRSTLKKQVNFKQEGQKLKVDFEGDRRHHTLRLFIKAPDLSSIKLFDTGDVTIKGFEFEDFALNSTGHQEVRCRFDATNLSVNLEKNSKLWLDGEGDFFTAFIEDRSSLYATDFDVRKAEVKTKDREWKKIRMSVTDTLIHELTGNEEFRIEGKPWILDKNREEDITDSE